MTLHTPTAARPAGALPAIAVEQLRAVAEARRRLRPVSRAAVVSTISGWTLAVFAAIALISGLFDLPSLLLGLGMSVSAWVELRGSRGLRTFDLAAPRRLAWNQVAVAAIVIAYAAWGIGIALFGPGPYDDQMRGGGAVAEAFEPFDRMTRSLTAAFYGLVIVLTLGVQAGSTLYHFTRRGHLAAFLRDTDPSIVEMLVSV